MMRAFILAGVSALALMGAAPYAMAHNHGTQNHDAQATAQAETPVSAENPFFSDWSAQPLGAPPFGQIREEHFMPAYQRGFEEQLAEVNAIAANRRRPTFDNTIAAMERSGALLRRVDGVFGNISGTDTTAGLQAIERDVAPLASRHESAILLNPMLFSRVQRLYERRDRLRLTPEQVRVLELYYDTFVRAGAALPPEARARVASINEQLSTLSTSFAQNQLADTAAWTLRLNGEEDLAGLPDGVREAALANGEALGRPGESVITLQRSSVEPFLQYATRRDLREQAFRAWAARGENANQYDNRAIITQILALRAEAARLMGYDSWAHYELDDRMAATPAAAEALMDTVWPAARARALEERAEMQALIDAEGGGFQLQPWDWRYYAEKVRLSRYQLNDAELRPYLQLDSMIEGMFYTANRLFGVTFEERTDIPVYNPSVRAFEVKNAAGDTIGLYFLDPYARPSKRSGAWMNAFRSQERMDGQVTPVVVNVLNYSAATPGEPTLLSWDDADTLFHEFGHALHGLLSNVTYRRIAGTWVQRDYVEFPSQVFEAWLGTDEILTRFARHAETGEPMPADLIARLRNAQTFNQGFSTVEYLASAYIDLDLHLADPEGLNLDAAEQATLARLDMPAEIIARHRPTHFGHIFAGGYAAGYYGYIWAEVYGADAFEAFGQAGDVFDPTTAEKFYTYVFSAGNLRDPREAYHLFRGRAPQPDALMRQRGFPVN